MKTLLFGQKKINFEINATLWKINRENAACHKNAVYFLVA
jgi:hypothetical protein